MTAARPPRRRPFEAVRRRQQLSPGRSDAMRIAVLGPAWFPVPPPGYGGTEAEVALLADGLVACGHDVTLFASGDSQSRARIRAAHERAPSDQIGRTEPELLHALACIRAAGEFDIISSHAGTLALALSGLVEAPFLHTVYSPVTGPAGRVLDAALAVAPRTGLVALSESQRAPRPDHPWQATIPCAVDLDAHPCRSRAGGRYLLWIGRMCREKGPDRAITVAQQAGVPLVLAGKMREPAELAYFRRHVEPRLGTGIDYVGEVGRARRVDLLHDAIALINPLEWPEPFGLVMIEAMACGVPVLATRRGSVSEIVEHGVSGIVVDDFRELAAAIDTAAALSPGDCRYVVEERFSPARMVEAYAQVMRAAALQPDALGTAMTRER